MIIAVRSTRILTSSLIDTLLLCLILVLLPTTAQANSSWFVDCTPEATTKSVGTQVEIVCEAYNSQNQAGTGVYIDGEIVSGPNDPDGGSNPPPDFTNQQGNEQGALIYRYSGSSNGTDVICFWADENNAQDINEGEESCTESEYTDRVSISWTGGSPPPNTAQLDVDCGPETSEGAVGQPFHIDCLVVRAEQPMAGIEIDGEILAGGAHDQDGTTAPEDFGSATTGSDGIATLSYTAGSSSAGGVDLVCLWIDQNDSTSDIDDGGQCTEDHDTDVLQRTWRSSDGGADLVAHNLAIYPPAPTVGDEVTFFGAVLNDGPEASDGYSTLVELDGKTLSMGGAKGLASGEIDELRGGTWTATPGHHKITLQVQPIGDMPDLVPDNNRAVVGFDVAPRPKGGPPDLRVESVQLDVPEVSPGTRDTFVARVANVGGRPAASFFVRYLLDGQEAGSSRVASIGPGESLVVRSPHWRATPGTHRLVAIVDPTNIVRESNDSNNQAGATFSVQTTPTAIGRANLVASIPQASFDDPQARNRLTFSSSVTNTGLAPSKPTVGRFLLDGTKILNTVSLPALHPGETFDLSSKAWLATAGSHLVALVVDPGDKLREASEKDNVVKAAISVDRPPTGRPNLTLAKVAVGPSRSEHGDLVRISAAIGNLGTGVAKPANVRFLLDGKRLGEAITDPIDPRGVTVATWGPLLAREGEHRLTAIVDPGSTISETSNKDNRRTIRWVVAPSGGPMDNSDLVAAGVKPSTDQPVEGDEVRFTAHIKNDGETDSPEFDVSFRIDGTLVSAVHVGNLRKGGVTTVTSDPWKATPGEHEVQLVLDPDNAVVELDESNNLVSETFSVAPAHEEAAGSPASSEKGSDLTPTLSPASASRLANSAGERSQAANLPPRWLANGSYLIQVRQQNQTVSQASWYQGQIGVPTLLDVDAANPALCHSPLTSDLRIQIQPDAARSTLTTIRAALDIERLASASTRLPGATIVILVPKTGDAVTTLGEDPSRRTMYRFGYHAPDNQNVPQLLHADVALDLSGSGVSATLNLQDSPVAVELLAGTFQGQAQAQRVADLATCRDLTLYSATSDEQATQAIEASMPLQPVGAAAGTRFSTAGLALSLATASDSDVTVGWRSPATPLAMNTTVTTHSANPVTHVQRARTVITATGERMPSTLSLRYQTAGSGPGQTNTITYNAGEDLPQGFRVRVQAILPAPTLVQVDLSNIPRFLKAEMRGDQLVRAVAGSSECPLPTPNAPLCRSASSIATVRVRKVMGSSFPPLPAGDARAAPNWHGLYIDSATNEVDVSVPGFRSVVYSYAPPSNTSRPRYLVDLYTLSPWRMPFSHRSPDAVISGMIDQAPSHIKIDSDFESRLLYSGNAPINQITMTGEIDSLHAVDTCRRGARGALRCTYVLQPVHTTLNVDLRGVPAATGIPSVNCLVRSTSPYLVDCTASGSLRYLRASATRNNAATGQVTAFRASFPATPPPPGMPGIPARVHADYNDEQKALSYRANGTLSSLEVSVESDQPFSKSPFRRTFVRVTDLPGILDIQVQKRDDRFLSTNTILLGERRSSGEFGPLPVPIGKVHVEISSRPRSDATLPTLANYLRITDTRGDATRPAESSIVAGVSGLRFVRLNTSNTASGTHAITDGQIKSAGGPLDVRVRTRPRRANTDDLLALTAGLPTDVGLMIDKQPHANYFRVDPIGGPITNPQVWMCQRSAPGDGFEPRTCNGIQFDINVGNVSSPIGVLSDKAGIRAFTERGTQGPPSLDVRFNNPRPNSNDPADPTGGFGRFHLAITQPLPLFLQAGWLTKDRPEPRKDALQFWVDGRSGGRSDPITATVQLARTQSQYDLLTDRWEARTVPDFQQRASEYRNVANVLLSDAGFDGVYARVNNLRHFMLCNNGGCSTNLEPRDDGFDVGFAPGPPSQDPYDRDFEAYIDKQSGAGSYGRFLEARVERDLPEELHVTYRLTNPETGQELGPLDQKEIRYAASSAVNDDSRSQGAAGVFVQLPQSNPGCPGGFCGNGRLQFTATKLPRWTAIRFKQEPPGTRAPISSLVSPPDRPMEEDPACPENWTPNSIEGAANGELELSSLQLVGLDRKQPGTTDRPLWWGKLDSNKLVLHPGALPANGDPCANGSWPGSCTAFSIGLCGENPPGTSAAAVVFVGEPPGAGRRAPSEWGTLEVNVRRYGLRLNEDQVFDPDSAAWERSLLAQTCAGPGGSSPGFSGTIFAFVRLPLGALGLEWNRRGQWVVISNLLGIGLSHEHRTPAHSLTPCDPSSNP